MVIIELPFPKFKGVLTVEEAIWLRRSIREFEDKPLTIDQLSQILWAAQGISYPPDEFRTAPSAGATYPLEVYVVIGENGVEGLKAGIYHYLPKRHAIELRIEGDFRERLYRACLFQSWVLKAPVNIVITAVYRRTTRIYGERGIRYVHFEVGHVGQNIYLQATALGLGTVAIGAFYDEEIKKILRIEKDEEPLYVFPIGVPKYWPRSNTEEIIQYIKSNR